MLTTFDLGEYVYTALRFGAVGFLLKDAEAAEIVNAVRVAAAGDAILAPRITRLLLRSVVAPEPSRPAEAARRLEALTDKSWR